MSEIVIQADGLGKLFRIEETEGYKTLRDTLMEVVSAPKRLLHPKGQNTEKKSFWALKDVSFEIKRGDLVGVIGRNGAGKSTLLKILSRITEPTEGHCEIHGRVGSLLEVGTGFHPELSGRENIFLNGAILGMKKSEIIKKFDEIVAFSELEKFIDTPVKHYSSGMYMRLAFAVAAHLETEVLLVDEVLAVGDAEFQKKCLGKMEDVSKGGRTVLFVSHTMSAIQQLCTRAILLSGGKVEYQGAVEATIEHYLSSCSGAKYTSAPKADTPTLTSIEASWSREDNEISLVVSFESPFTLKPPILGFTMFDYSANPIFGTNTRFEWSEGLPEEMKAGVIEAWISTESLRPGTYYLSFWLGDHYQDYDIELNAVNVAVDPDSVSPLQPPRSAIGSSRLATRYRYSAYEPSLTARKKAPICS